MHTKLNPQKNKREKSTQHTNSRKVKVEYKKKEKEKRTNKHMKTTGGDGGVRRDPAPHARVRLLCCLS